MIDFKNFLTEGVYDKHIFKAFFLAGGPGSGKSWVASRTLEGSGMKVINTTKTQLQYAVDGRLGLILDSTARDIPRIETEKRGLDFIGYDTYMVFVNTTLETALKRNQMRPRKVPDSIVIQSHKQIQANRQKLKNIFGSNYVEVDNDFDLAHINSEVYKKINKLKKPKYSKQMAKDWVAMELEMKKQAGQKKTSVFSLFGRRK